MMSFNAFAVVKNPLSNSENHHKGGGAPLSVYFPFFPDSTLRHWKNSIRDHCLSLPVPHETHLGDLSTTTGLCADPRPVQPFPLVTTFSCLTQGQPNPRTKIGFRSVHESSFECNASGLEPSHGSAMLSYSPSLKKSSTASMSSTTLAGEATRLNESFLPIEMFSSQMMNPERVFQSSSAEETKSLHNISEQPSFKTPGLFPQLPESHNLTESNHLPYHLLDHTQTTNDFTEGFSAECQFSGLRVPGESSVGVEDANKGGVTFAEAPSAAAKPLSADLFNLSQPFFRGFPGPRSAESKPLEAKMEVKAPLRCESQVFSDLPSSRSYAPFPGLGPSEANILLDSLPKDHNLSSSFFPRSTNKSIGQLVEEELLSAPPSRGSSCTPSLSSSNRSYSSSPLLSQNPPKDPKFDSFLLDGIFTPSYFSLIPPPEAVPQSSIPKKFFCEKCGKGHTRQSNLLAHLRDTHSNTKKVFCDVEGCKKAYKRVSECRRHKKDMHGIPLPSEILGKVRKARRLNRGPSPFSGFSM